MGFITPTPSYYLALDPGDTSGWATFDESGNSTGFDDVRGPVEFYELLRVVKPGLIICENYRLFPWLSKEQSWSHLDTVRLIGATEFYCYLRNITLVLQDPTVKKIAYMWAGIKPPKNHKESHMTDAYVHGVYYLQKNGIRTPQQGAAT